MKDEKQIREMASSLLDIKDARDHVMELWTSPWAECLMNVLGERKSNGHSIEIMNDYYYLTDRRKENFRKRHGLRPMDKSLYRKLKQ